jgi:hypothetical protein
VEAESQGNLVARMKLLEANRTPAERAAADREIHEFQVRYNRLVPKGIVRELLSFQGETLYWMFPKVETGLLNPTDPPASGAKKFQTALTSRDSGVSPYSRIKPFQSDVRRDALHCSLDNFKTSQGQ